MPVAPKAADYFCEGTPVNGTDEVQTITFGGTPTGGTFTLTFGGLTTGAISWSATNNTLRDNIDTALEALANIGASEVTTAVGTMTGGIGTITVTFAAALGKLNVPLMTAASSLTGTLPTLAVDTTTPGVTATARGAAAEATLQDSSGNLYINKGTTTAPVWLPLGA